MVRDVQQQGEGGNIAQVLDHTLGGVHGGILGGAGGVVILGLLGALVGQQEAQVGLVRVGGGDAGVHIHIVIQGDVIVALSGDGHVPLAQNGVDEAVDQGAVVVVLLHDELRGVHIVHPGGNLILGVVLALPGDGVAQHSPVDVGAPEQSDGFDHLGGDPPGIALLVDLKPGGGEHERGVLEPQVAQNVPIQGLGEGVLHPLPLREADHLGLLGDHVHHHIGGQTLAPVGEPLDQVGVGDGGHPHGPALVVDLGGAVGVVKLTDHVAEGAHLPVPQVVGGVPVQSGDLIEGDLTDVLGELPVLHGEQVPVGPRPEDGHGDDLAHYDHNDHGDEQDANRQALLLDKGEILLQLSPLEGLLALFPPEPGGHQSAQQVDHAQHEHKAVKLPGLEVDGRDGHIEVDRPRNQGNQEVQQDIAQPAPGGPGRCVRISFQVTFSFAARERAL